MFQRGKDSEIKKLSDAFGMDFGKLKNMVEGNLNERTINEYGRLDQLKASVDRTKAREFFERITGEKLSPPNVIVKIDNLLRAFILSGGFDIEETFEKLKKTASPYGEDNYSQGLKVADKKDGFE